MKLRRQDGQMIPALMVLMLAILAVGLAFFQVGRAAIFSTEAQTAADAAALGAVQEVKAQLQQQVAATGYSSVEAIDPIRVRLQAELWARRNKAHVVRLDRRGVDVKVWVSTNDTLGEDADRVDSSGARGEGRARARIDVLALPSVGASIGSGGGGAGAIERIKGDDWDALKDDISDPPTCGNSAASNDVVRLGRLLRAHGFAVAENAELGDDPQPGVHEATGYHYRCRHAAAIDVNADGGPGTEKQIIDGIVGKVQDLGFRTIWQAAGHFDHIHIDVANSGPIGVGGSDGGAVGALEETTLDVKLIDWEAAYTPFAGLGGIGSGGFYGGPPDPAVANALCGALAATDASPKIRLATFETAIVESGVHNLNYGDRDSVGVFQQRPSQGWGIGYSVMDPSGAAREFIRRAKIQNAQHPGYSAGQLSQSVQISGFPDRYDQVAGQASAMLAKYCGGV